MDVEKLIEASKICADPQGDCNNCPCKGNCVCGLWLAEIIAVRDHYEALLKSERSKVIAEVREWVNDDDNTYSDTRGNPVLCKFETLRKLDSMEETK